MKSKLNIILYIFICFIAIGPMNVLADNAGGTGSRANGNGIAGGTRICQPDRYWQVGYDFGSGATVRPAAYRFDLVYYKDGKRMILRSVIAVDEKKVFNRISPKTNMVEMVKHYAKSLQEAGVSKAEADSKSSKWNVKYVNSGPFINLIDRFMNGETVDSIFKWNKPGMNVAENQRLIESYITDSKGFGMKLSDLTREQDENPGRLGSYGYRILIQKLNWFIDGCDTRDGAYSSIIMTRKDAASGNAVKRKLAGNRAMYIAATYAIYSSELFTTIDDMGIRNANSSMKAWTESARGDIARDATKSHFADYKDGAGYNILWFSTKSFKKYNYSLDVACVGCNSTLTSKMAMVIQDTTNWTAILNSAGTAGSECNKNINGYYHKGNGVFCREQFYIYYPNAKSKITVQTGSYFTVNETAESIRKAGSSMPNLQPIKVKRTRRCKDNAGGKKLNSFKKANSFVTNKYTNCGGDIYLTYTEPKYGVKNVQLVAYKGAAYDKISGNFLDQSAYYYYRLPSNFYRYVTRSGESKKKKPSNTKRYTDLKISNLPISLDAGLKTVRVGLKYSLPSKKCGDSKITIDKAYNNNPNYLRCSGQNGSYENIYMGSVTGDDIKNSACAKLFGNTTSKGFKDCVALRKSKKNKTGNCITTNNAGNYVCNYKVIEGKCNSFNHELWERDWNPNNGGFCCKEGEVYDKETKKCEPSKPNVCTKDNAESMGKIWAENQPNDAGGIGACCESDKYAEETKTCCNEGEDYNPDTGKCEKEEQCTKETAEVLGREWSEIDNRCCDPETEALNKETGKCDKDNNNKKCNDLIESGDCPEEACCYDEDRDVASCGIVKNGKKLCPSKPSVTNFTYRVIDPSNPFVNQDGSTRETGSNWCNGSLYENGTLTKKDCSSNNELVKNVIKSSQVSEADALYKVHLDSDSIGRIRNYNKSHDYDDDSIECDANGDCSSVFLRKENSNLGLTIEGKCRDVKSENCK